VPNVVDPDETFEIINVTGNVLTVKGSMTGSLAFKQFGVFYGSTIKSFIADANGNGFRDIKFFKPENEANGYGGYIDTTGGPDAPFTSAPVGLCQACHNQTKYWKTDGSIGNGTHNPANNPCRECHDITDGAGGGAPHVDFIADDVETDGARQCSLCHPGYILEPELAHTSGCNTCHVPNAEPAINSNPMPTGEPDSDVGNPTANLTDAVNATSAVPSSYTQYSFTGVIDTDTNRLTDGTYTIKDAGYESQMW
jgi:hypothetical protein